MVVPYSEIRIWQHNFIPSTIGLVYTSVPRCPLNINWRNKLAWMRTTSWETERWVRATGGPALALFSPLSFAADAWVWTLGFVLCARGTSAKTNLRARNARGGRKILFFSLLALSGGFSPHSCRGSWGALHRRRRRRDHILGSLRL